MDATSTHYFVRSKQFDQFSNALGVLLYFMVCGVLPFRASNDFEVFQRIKSGKFRPLPSFVSEDLKQLLESIFIPDNGRRPTIRKYRLAAPHKSTFFVNSINTLSPDAE